MYALGGVFGAAEKLITFVAIHLECLQHFLYPPSRVILRASLCWIITVLFIANETETQRERFSNLLEITGYIGLQKCQRMEPSITKAQAGDVCGGLCHIIAILPSLRKGTLKPWKQGLEVGGRVQEQKLCQLHVRGHSSLRHVLGLQQPHLWPPSWDVPCAAHVLHVPSHV